MEIQNNPFNSLSSIFSEMSGYTSFTLLWKNEKEIEERIVLLSQKVICILEQPLIYGIDVFALFKLKHKISHLRKTDLKNCNYAGCEAYIRKIEAALEKHCKDIQIGHRTLIDSCFRQGITCPKLFHVLMDVFENTIPLTIAVNSLNQLPFNHSPAFALLLSMLGKSLDKIEYFNLITKNLFDDSITNGKSYEILFDILEKQADGGHKLLQAADPIIEMHRAYPIERSQNRSMHLPLILSLLSVLLEGDEEIDSAILKCLFSNRIRNKCNNDLLMTLSKVPKERRKGALLHAAKFFSPELGFWEKLTFILEVALSPSNKEDPFEIATLINVESTDVEDYFHAIENLSVLDRNFDLLNSVNEVFNKLEPFFTHSSKLFLILIRIGIGDKERLDRLKNRVNEAKRLHREIRSPDKDKLINCLDYLSDIPDEGLSDIMDNFCILSKNWANPRLFPDALPILACTPKDQRNAFINSVKEVIQEFEDHLDYPFGKIDSWKSLNSIILGIGLFSRNERNLIFTFLSALTGPKNSFYFNKLKFNSFFEICLFYSSPCFMTEYLKCEDTKIPFSLNKYNELMIISITYHLSRNIPEILYEAITKVKASFQSNALSFGMKVIQFRNKECLNLPLEIIHQIALKAIYLAFSNNIASFWRR